jgi:hypothetical protein
VPDFNTFVSIHDSIKLGLTTVSNLTDNGQLLRQYDRLSLADQRFDNLIWLGQLLFSPNTPEVQQLISYLNATYSRFEGIYGGIFETEDEAVDYSLRDLTLDSGYVPTDPYKYRPWALLNFREINFLTSRFDYSIRCNYTTVPSTNSQSNRFILGFSSTYQRYIYSGFSTLQHTIEKYIMQNTNTSFVSNPYQRTNIDYITAPFPLTTILINPFYQNSGPFVGLIVCLSFLYAVSRLVKSIVEEKELKSKVNKNQHILYHFICNIYLLRSDIFFDVCLGNHDDDGIKK